MVRFARRAYPPDSPPPFPLKAIGRARAAAYQGKEDWAWDRFLELCEALSDYSVCNQQHMPPDSGLLARCLAELTARHEAPIGVYRNADPYCFKTIRDQTDQQSWSEYFYRLLRYRKRPEVIHSQLVDRSRREKRSHGMRNRAIQINLFDDLS